MVVFHVLRGRIGSEPATLGGQVWVRFQLFCALTVPGGRGWAGVGVGMIVSARAGGEMAIKNRKLGSKRTGISRTDAALFINPGLPP